MTLRHDYHRQLKHWLEEVQRHFWYSIGTVAFEGFMTREHLSRDESLLREFSPCPAGTSWGPEWEYGWFRTSVRIPDEGAGQWVVLVPSMGGEMCEAQVWIDGEQRETCAFSHPTIELSRKAKAGDTYDLLMETWVSYGKAVRSFTGPLPPDREGRPVEPLTSVTLGTHHVAVWQEDAFQLWLDLSTLFGIRESLDPEARRVHEIDEGLCDIVRIVDFELPRDESLATVRRGRERLKPLMECANDGETPLIYLCGHGHLDVEWKWPIEVTNRKFAVTLMNQLQLFEEYPESNFVVTQPLLFRDLKAQYPELYQRVKESVANGNLLPDGVMWVEPDANLPSGESLIRQILWGKRFMQEEFGIDSRMLWLSDTFGFTGALPQILKGCGVDYFTTAKMYWGSEGFPYEVFDWEGIDGSKVLCGFTPGMGWEVSSRLLINLWERLRQKEIGARLAPQGWGDGGGGPARDHAEAAKRCRDLAGVPRTRYANPLEYFKHLEACDRPTYTGELYLSHHRGTYTSVAALKKGNRRAETALHEAEFWATAAAKLAAADYPREGIDDAWDKVLLNQFHDVIPGSSVNLVNRTAIERYDAAIQGAGRIAFESLEQLTKKEPDAVTVFNSLSWDRRAVVTLPEGMPGAAGPSGEALQAQEQDGRVQVEVTVPACGWTTLTSVKPAAPGDAVKAETGLLENDLLKVIINGDGEITSLYDKEHDCEWAAGACNRFRMFKDVPLRWDAWDIEKYVEDMPVDLDAKTTVSAGTSGPLFGSLKVRKVFCNSSLEQEIILRKGSRRIEFKTTVDWHEQHKLLKVAFPAAVHANEALHEIQFGHLARPNDRSTPAGQERFEVWQQRWTALAEPDRGCAVLNDCKYGVGVLENAISLTLLRAPTAPDPIADRGEHRFTYAFTAWHGSFEESRVVQEGYDLNVFPLTVEGEAGERSLFAVSSPNVILETVKSAEDGSGDVILRLYESMGSASRATVTVDLPVKAAVLADMLENGNDPVELSGGGMELNFRPFEVKTVRMTV